VTKQDILENPVNMIYLGLGSNLGNKKKNIENAKFELIKNQIRILESSNYYVSLSWPNPSYPKFLNIILKIETDLKPKNLLKICKNIEKKIGRKKRLKNSPRECDIDIIDFKSKKMKGSLNLPHPSMHLRNFVLLPLFEINKTWIHPILKLDIKNLILSLPNKDIRSIKQI